MAKPAGQSILIVDDSSFDRQLLRELLGQSNYIVHTATDGRQGYEMAVGLRPDLILLDLRMPQLDGLATCRLLKANRHTAGIPLIFLSGTDSVDDRVEGLRAGSVDFISKPYSAGELLARIAIHLKLATRTQDEAPAVHAASHPDDVLVAAARALIDSDLAAVPRLEDIADRVGSYREKLNRAFRSRLGMTVFEYIRERRLSMATALLVETEMSVTEIADLIGYNSAANFSTAFRERTGATPIAYRRAHGTASADMETRSLQLGPYLDRSAVPDLAPSVLMPGQHGPAPQSRKSVGAPRDRKSGK